MGPLSSNSLHQYWSNPFIATNIIIVLNLLGALALGMLVGFERWYKGRAAGMRTYGLVCMASAALTVMMGYPQFWYGGQAFVGFPDPGRVIQGVLTGLGFLGAGVIMKDGLNISGLTTAASIWAACAIGVLVGVGFYAAAIVMAATAALSMVWVSRLEAWLPSHTAILIVLRFKKGYAPEESTLRRVALERGYDIASGSLSVNYQDGHQEWRFSATASNKRNGVSVAQLSAELARFDGVVAFSVSQARN